MDLCAAMYCPVLRCHQISGSVTLRAARAKRPRNRTARKARSLQSSEFIAVIIKKVRDRYAVATSGFESGSTALTGLPTAISDWCTRGRPTSGEVHSPGTARLLMSNLLRLSRAMPKGGKVQGEQSVPTDSISKGRDGCNIGRRGPAIAGVGCAEQASGSR